MSENDILPEGKAMAFDFGLARVGVAIGDSETQHAQPLVTLRAKYGCPDWRSLSSLVAVWQPVILVVGRPERCSQNALLCGIKSFARGLRRRFPHIPLTFSSEDYTSTFAYSLLLEKRARCHRRTIRKGDIDKTAAALILEGWFFTGGESGRSA